MIDLLHLEKYQENNADIAESISNIIEFAGNLRNNIESSRMQDRRELFGIILSNSVIDGRKAWFCLKKPFDSLLKSNGYLTWLGCISFSRTRDVLDLLSLGSNIQKILSRIQA